MSTAELDLLMAYLGGKSAMGIKKSQGPLTLHKAIEAGIPAHCAIYFREHAGLTNVMISHLLGVSEKTYIRWQSHPEKALDPVVSDRLVRSAKIMALAEHVLESAENAKRWIGEAQAALGGEVPRDLLTTDVGANQVEELLLQMEHGHLA